MSLILAALSSFLMSPLQANSSSSLKAEPFALSQVRLLDSPFLKAERVCVDYLLRVEPDRLLSGFRTNSGLTPKAKIYDGWENSGLAGHSLGHYLSACAQEYASSRDQRFKDKVDYIVADLAECQKKRPDGYIAAIPDGDAKWAEIKKGEIHSGGFDLNGMWSPWYTNHKVLAGLLDAYRLVGNKQALEVAKKFADWAIDETKALSRDDWQKMLRCEYGGMNESLAELYSITKEGKYLDLSRKFYDDAILNPLKQKKDVLSGKHSNTQIPKLIGLARLYEVDGKQEDRDASEFFWDAIVHHHTYAIGGNSNHEYLGAPDQLSNQLSSNTCETCNTYNMLKLTRHLFEWDPKAEYFDFYERAHLNHILASQDPRSAGVTYFMPLGTGEERRYSSLWTDWTCCHGSGMENHTKHADSIYFHESDKKLYVNLFIPSELNWSGLSVKLETKFPNDGAVKLTIGADRHFELAVRHPGWATESFDILVNGKKEIKTAKPSSYALIERDWKKGDVVEFKLPMKLHTEPMPDNENRVAILYGPVVLAAEMGDEKSLKPRTPVLLASGDDPSKWLTRSSKGPLAFVTSGVGKPNELTFVPFYAVDHQRYGVYFDLFGEAQWQQAESAYRAEEERVRDLEARTLDFMRVGEMQPERDHKLESERNDVREANGRSFRTPLNGGWFQAVMKSDPKSDLQLVVTYWGNDRLKPDFDLLVNGQKIASETLEGRPANEFYDVVYDLPKDVTKGQSSLTIKVQAHEGKAAGSICGLRVVRSKK